MARIILLLLFHCFFYAQNLEIIDVYINRLDHRFALFEQALIQDVIGLYNKKNTVKLRINFQRARLSEMFKLMDSLSVHHPDAQVCAINSITFLPERHRYYDFSGDYFPAGECLYSRADKPSPKEWNRHGRSIGVVEGSLYESYFDFYPTNHINLVKFTHSKYKHEALQSGKIDYILGDLIETWTYENVAPIHIFSSKKPSYYAFMFPKGSSLVKKLNPYLEYYIGTGTYHRRIKDLLGEDALSYFELVYNLKRGKK